MRRGTCLVFALGALGTGSALAAHGLITLAAQPVMDVPVVVDFRTPAKLKQPVYLTAQNSRGTVRVRMSAVVPHRWRGRLTFPTSGGWTLTVAGVQLPLVVQPPPASTFAPAGATDCSPPSPSNARTSEILGTNGFWALLGSLDVRAGALEKIVVRLGGSGDAAFSATGPDGSTLQPRESIVHGGSNWLRPGDEWGTIWTFPTAGCWDIHAERGGIASDLWLVVR